MSFATRIENHDGTTGTWVSLKGDMLVLRMPRAFAPGAPLQIRVELKGPTEPAVTVDAKSIGSRKIGDDFEVKAKLVNVSRSARTALDAAWLTVT